MRRIEKKLTQIVRQQAKEDGRFMGNLKDE